MKPIKHNNKPFRILTEIQLNEKVNYLTNKLFGRSKETLFEETNGQLNLFSDEEISVSVPSHHYSSKRTSTSCRNESRQNQTYL
ncbi:hypothetical protein [Enterococcus faecium]|uniref:IS66 family transposase n=1 Tax=Enterococcus faecium TaxID=1352 RepID=UPI00351EFAF8